MSLAGTDPCTDPWRTPNIIQNGNFASASDACRGPLGCSELPVSGISPWSLSQGNDSSKPITSISYLRNEETFTGIIVPASTAMLYNSSVLSTGTSEYYWNWNAGIDNVYFSQTLNLSTNSSYTWRFVNFTDCKSKYFFIIGSA